MTAPSTTQTTTLNNSTNSSSSSSSTYITIAILVITLIILIIYAIVVVWMFIQGRGLFAPFTPTPPDSPDKIFRPLGSPTPFTPEEIAARQKLAATVIATIQGST